jgi:hypothetical protein
VEVIEPASYGGKGKGKALPKPSTSSTAALRPLTSNSSLTNALSSTFQPLASSSFSSSRITNGWATANETSKKPKLSQSKADQWLPGFAKSGGTTTQTTLVKGEVLRPKVTKATRKK